MLVTSGLFYAIVPSGATLALRVLSSLQLLFQMRKSMKISVSVSLLAGTPGMVPECSSTFLARLY